jgi:hypothetical protein
MERELKRVKNAHLFLIQASDGAGGTLITDPPVSSGSNVVMPHLGERARKRPQSQVRYGSGASFLGCVNRFWSTPANRHPW